MRFLRRRGPALRKLASAHQGCWGDWDWGSRVVINRKGISMQTIGIAVVVNMLIYLFEDSFDDA